MSTAPAQTRYTPDDLLRMPDGDFYELVDGYLVERNMSAQSSWVGGNINRLVGNHCIANPRTGLVIQADCSYQCFPDDPNKVRKPDGSFIRHGRLPAEEFAEGHVTIAPDWVLEVLSPKDLAYEVDRKVREYLRAGVKLIWVVNPDVRTVRVYRANGSSTELREADDLAGEDVIPGFRCKVADLFPPAEQPKSEARVE